MDMQHQGETGAADDPLVRARALIPLLQQAAPRIDAARELPPDVLDAMFAAGMFRLLVPRSCGGAELEPATYVQCVEAVAMGDASAAWCMNQGSVSMMSAAYLGLDAARDAFGGDRDVLAWGYGPNGRGGAGRGRLARHRPMVVRQWQPARDLARGALSLRGARRHAAAGAWRQAVGTHGAVPA